MRTKKTINIESTHREVLQRFDTGRITSVKLLRSSPRKVICRVAAAKGEYVLSSVVKTNISSANLRDRVQLQEFLVEQAFPVPRVLRTVDGDYCARTPEATFTLESFIHGTVFSEPLSLPPEALVEAAKVLAFYHRLIRTVNPPWMPNSNTRYSPDMFVDSSAAMAMWRLVFKATPYGANLDKMEKRIRAVAVDKIRRIAKLRGSTEQINSRIRHLPRVLSHGDYRADNLVFQGRTVAGVLDWELARTLPRAWEVLRASCAMSCATRAIFNSPLDENRFTLFLRAYQEIEPLSSEELLLMADMGVLASLCPSHFLISRYERGDKSKRLLPRDDKDWWYWEEKVEEMRCLTLSTLDGSASETHR